MPSKLKPIRAPKVDAPILSSFTHMEMWKSEFAARLGINDNTVRAEAVERFNAVLSDAKKKLISADGGPLRAHLIAAHEDIRARAEGVYRDTERLLRIIKETGEPYRSSLPDIPEAGDFLAQLGIFHDQLSIGLSQMRGLPNARGGARKVEQAKAKEVVHHALRTFFDLNATDANGELRSASLNEQGRTAWESFVEDRDDFVAWAADTAGLLPAKVKPKARAASKAAPRRKQRTR